MPRYYYKKENFKIDKIEYARIYFDNNEFVSLSKDEVLDFKFEYKDRLINFRDGIYPVINSGYINFNIKKYSSGTIRSNFVCNEKEYIKNRKKYIFNRCIEGKIVCIEFFNNKNWSMKVFGNFNSVIKDENMSFEILDSKNKILSEDFYIDLPIIKKGNVNKIDLIFENCENLVLLKQDLLEVNLTYNANLELGSSYFEREVIGGLIKIKFNKDIKYRDGSLLDLKGKDISIRKAIKRLFLSNAHNICGLGIYFDQPGFGDLFKEFLLVNNIKINKDYEYDFSWFTGGYVKKEKNIIIIKFN